MNLDIAMPEGCQASVTYNEGGGQFTSQVVCGPVTNRCEVDYSPQLFSRSRREKAWESIVEDTVNVLGAMCLGCSNLVDDDIAPAETKKIRYCRRDPQFRL